MSKRWVLALDQGTTSSRAILFDRRGQVVAVAQQEFRQHYPQPGWVEHDAEEIWSTQLATAQQVLEKAGVAPHDVAAIGITNQRETTVLWDRMTGKPVAPAIVWQDRRTAGMCDALKAQGAEAVVREKTGLVLDPYFSATKIAWLLDNVNGLRSRAERGEIALGTIDSWLVYRLTGGRVHVTDYSNASRTMLLNIHTLAWDDELLALFGRIPAGMLPQVLPSSHVYGETDPAILGAPIPIAGIAGDQQAALFGQTCFDAGMAKNTYGTGSFLLMNTGGKPVMSKHGLLTTVAWGVGGKVSYALEGSVFVTGAAVQWLRDGLGIIANAAETQALASSVADTGGVYLVPAFAGLGAPYWDPYARGILVGITRGTTRAHVVRAALEAIAYQTVDVMRAMEQDAGVPLRALRVDGGAAVNNFLMQFQADALNVPVERPAVTETTALGAAYLAGLAAGVWEGLDEIRSQWHLDERFEPTMDAARRETLLAGWRRAVERCRGWAASEGES
ncbi:MAG: glycerol kinase [Firmicutes bacterium ZCTH02-B6]|nr:MAG: glycerol kinase [Firmicutes bacterium ZCTH02-B6]